MSGHPNETERYADDDPTRERCPGCGEWEYCCQCEVNANVDTVTGSAFDVRDLPDDPQQSPLYVAQEALNFYAHNTPDRIKEDGGSIARETLAQIKRMASD